MIQLLANKIKPKRNKVELRVDQNVIDFKKYSKEPISAEQLLEIDSHVETSEEIEEQLNEENTANEGKISNKDALDFNEDDFNSLIKIKNKVEKNLENNQLKKQ